MFLTVISFSRSSLMRGGVLAVILLRIVRPSQPDLSGNLSARNEKARTVYYGMPEIQNKSKTYTICSPNVGLMLI